MNSANPDTHPASLVTYDHEQALLGEIMTNRQAWGNIAGLVCAEDFSAEVHGDIYQRMQALSEEGLDISPITLWPRLCDNPELVSLGGAGYLTGMMASVVRIGAAPSLAREIRESSRRRELIQYLEEVCRRLLDLDYPLSEAAALAAQAVEKACEGEKECVTEHVIIEQIVAELSKNPDIDATGLTALDETMWGGLHRGRTYAFAAKEKEGKTTLAHTISYNLNEAGVQHAYFALEMGSDQIVHRQLARRLDINSLKFLTERSPGFASTVASAGFSGPNNVLHSNCAGITLDELRSQIGRLVTRHRKLRGIIVDYWQLVEGREKHHTEEQFLRTVAQTLANLGKRYGIWIIIIAQLNDAGELFGGRGLKKACDQLYNLRREPDGDRAWLEMVVTRYGPKANAGSPAEAALIFDNRIGPYFKNP